MSSIEKMEIRAMRSFGPDSDDAQTITFFKPLTLILGPNGTGKTTIIECLRYAATGDLPPGGNKNGAFIHDPKLCKDKQIKGQVKLMIKDVSGVPCTVVRSVSAKIKDAKAEKIEMKTMDGLICRVMPDGDKHSVTARCVDMNREMIAALGVSKAVLDNVIFCHQEDSNWPLGEGKMLKQKFDSIFDSTRYTKVLDELKKVQQAHSQDLRVGMEELKHLKEKKDKAHQLQGDIEDLKVRLAASESKVEDVETQLKPIKDRLEQIGKNSNEIYKLESQKQKYETEKDQIEITVKDLKKNIKNPYTGSVNQLKREIEKFASNLEDKRDQIKTSEKRQSDLARELEKIDKEKNGLLVEVGKLEQEAETHKSNIIKRNDKVKQLAEKYDFEGFDASSTIDEDDCKRFLNLLNDKLIESMNDAKSKKMSFDEEEGTIQGKIDNLRENKTKLEHSEKMKRETVDKNKKEIQEINKKLRHMASSAEKLGKIETDLKRVENDLSENENSMNCDEIKKEIDDDERKKRLIEVEFGELDSEMNRLHKQSVSQTELNMLKSDQEEKLETVNRLQGIHEENIIGLLGHMPVNDLRLSIETYKGDQSDCVRKCNSDLGTLKTKLTTKEAEKLEASNRLRQKERELREKEEKISDVCEREDFEEELSEVQRNLTQAQEEKGSLLGADHMIKRYIRGLEKNNPSCPLCLRGFERAQEIRELILTLEERRRKVPHNMRRAEQEMETQQAKYDNLMQLKPVRENITVIKEQDIPSLKTKVKKLDEEIKKIKQSMEDKEEELMSKESDLEIVNGMHSDIVLMDRYKGVVRELERKIASHSAMLSGNGSNRSIKEVIAEKEKKQLEIENISRILKHKRDKVSEFQDQIQRLRHKANTLKEEKLTIEGELQQKIQLENTKASLTSDNSNFERDIEESRSQIQPLENQIKKVLKEKEEIVTRKEEMLSHARELSDAIKGNANTVKNINKEVSNYIQSDKKERQKERKARQAILSQKQTRWEQDQEKVVNEIDALRKDIATQQINERELQDSLQLFRKQDEIKKLIVGIDDLKEKLQEFDCKNLERERQHLLMQEKNLTLELHRASGRQQGFKDEIKSKENDLEDKMFKNADKRYCDEVIKNRTIEIASADVNKYYRAMDQAIMRYHNTKMEEINRIILDLWKTTYTADDIDTIEIRSEGEEADIKARRNYNYRVVMLKTNIPIDMRGRCSAGQKVLASLIIRLALAETFCINCGILALDEPTTNLDRENIESLALALVKIIKERNIIRHFQLVVITHDTDFVELLSRADFVDQFIEVRKNENGLSRLYTRDVGDLQTRI